MEARKIGNPLVPGSLILFLILTAACSFLEGKSEPTPLQAGESGFTFNAPTGYTVREFENLTDSWMEAENLLFAQKKPISFSIYRKEIPEGSSLDALFEQYLAKEEPEANHFRQISKQEVRVFDRRGIEYVFAHFHGEPYVRTRQTWVENGGRVYILACSQPVSVDQAAQPISEECDRLLEGFEFK